MQYMLRSSSHRSRRVYRRDIAAAKRTPPPITVVLEVLLLGGYIGAEIKWRVSPSTSMQALDAMFRRGIRSWGEHDGHAHIYRKVGNSSVAMRFRGRVGTLGARRLYFCAVVPPRV